MKYLGNHLFYLSDSNSYDVQLYSTGFMIVSSVNARADDDFITRNNQTTIMTLATLFLLNDRKYPVPVERVVKINNLRRCHYRNSETFMRYIIKGSLILLTHIVSLF